MCLNSPLTLDKAYLAQMAPGLEHTLSVCAVGKHSNTPTQQQTQLSFNSTFVS